MSQFPVAVTTAVAAVALDHAANMDERIVVLLGDVFNPSGTITLSGGTLRNGLDLFRSAIRSTDRNDELIAQAWVSAGGGEVGYPTLVIGDDGQLILTHGTWQTDF